MHCLLRGKGLGLGQPLISLPPSPFRILFWRVRWEERLLGQLLMNRSRIHLPMQETQVMWVRPLGPEDPWRRKWQPTPVLLPGKSHGQKNLAGYSPWGHKRVGHDWATDHTHTHLKLDLADVYKWLFSFGRSLLWLDFRKSLNHSPTINTHKPTHTYHWGLCNIRLHSIYTLLQQDLGALSYQLFACIIHGLR